MREFAGACCKAERVARRTKLHLPAMTAMFVVLGMTARAAEPSLEYAVKGAYLYKFASFVEWPQTAFGEADGAVNVCIVGRDPFGPELDQAVAGQRLGPRAIVLRRIAVATRDSGCHIMFVGGSNAQSVAAALAAVRGTPVLTVTDVARPGGANGIIAFAIENNRVRFDIDDRAAGENGIQVRAPLLALARAVRPRGAP
jgi:hypothetical protein